MMINPSAFEKYLDEKFPHARCELNYTKDYELAIAVMLSAQTTDNAVNAVTKVLFSTYQSIEDFAKADIKDIENIIMPIGLYKNKAKHIKEFANQLMNLYDGKLPSNKDDLVKLSAGKEISKIEACEILSKVGLCAKDYINREINVANKEKYEYILKDTDNVFVVVTADEIEKYGDHKDYVLSVLPGLSGMWQISGRSDANYDERIYFDSFYIQNWSVWLDIWILIKTVWVVISGKGAY